MALTTINLTECKAYASGTWYGGSGGSIQCGTTAAGILYKTRIAFPAFNTLKGIKTITFYVKRSDGYASRTLSIGVNATAGTSQTSTIGSFSLASNTSWQTKDFTAYKSTLSAFTDTWYMYLWNSTDGQYCELVKSMYFVVETEDGAVYIGVNGVWVKCAVYMGVSGAWARVAPYMGVSGAWAQMGG